MHQCFSVACGCHLTESDLEREEEEDEEEEDDDRDNDKDSGMRSDTHDNYKPAKCMIV